MPLAPADRAYVLRTAADMLVHRDRERLLAILAERIAAGDYPDEHERDLDRIAHALARAVAEQLGGDEPP